MKGVCGAGPFLAACLTSWIGFGCRHWVHVSLFVVMGRLLCLCKGFWPSCSGVYINMYACSVASATGDTRFGGNCLAHQTACVPRSTLSVSLYRSAPPPPPPPHFVLWWPYAVEATLKSPPPPPPPRPSTLLSLSLNHDEVQSRRKPTSVSLSVPSPYKLRAEMAGRPDWRSGSMLGRGKVKPRRWMETLLCGDSSSRWRCLTRHRLGILQPTTELAR